MKRIYRGALINPSDEQITNNKSTLAEKTFILILRDGHWVAIYRLGGKLYEYDSFGRDFLGNEFKDSITRPEQKIQEYNCGQRTLNFIEKTLVK